jgi:hypothetical protein
LPEPTTPNTQSTPAAARVRPTASATFIAFPGRWSALDEGEHAHR